VIRAARGGTSIASGRHMKINALVLVPIVSAFATHAYAQVCDVDPTGSLGYPFGTIEDALTNGGCDQPGSEIVVHCPEWGCGHPATEIQRLDKITIMSGENPDKPEGPVWFDGKSDPWAVRVVDSRDIRFLGFSGYYTREIAIDVVDSSVRVAGPQELGFPFYADVQGWMGVHVAGASEVELAWVGVRGNTRGMRIESTANGTPKVSATGLAVLDNVVAVEMAGLSTTCPAPAGPLLAIHGDFGPTWLNYVMGNDEGFLLSGDARLEIDHTVLGGNLRHHPPNRANGFLFDLRDASKIYARNIVVYDNDRIVNPGVALPWSQTQGPNTASIVLWHASCEKSSILASSFVDNESDLLFHLDTSGTGRMILDHIVAANNSGKTISASGFWPGCPQLDVTGSMFWENRTGMDPPACEAGFTQTTNNVDPSIITAPDTDDQLPSYPKIVDPSDHIYRLDPFEPNTLPAPAGLYSWKDWGVDGSADIDAEIDVGFHNWIP
jgi:hypothetical protein